MSPILQRWFPLTAPIRNSTANKKHQGIHYCRIIYVLEWMSVFTFRRIGTIGVETDDIDLLITRTIGLQLLVGISRLHYCTVVLWVGIRFLTVAQP
jgi:hypothetical protein